MSIAYTRLVRYRTYNCKLYKLLKMANFESDLIPISK